MTSAGARTTARAQSPLHVLLTADVVGGVWDFCWTLAAELGRRGHRATLLVFGRPSPSQRLQAVQAGADLVTADLKLEWMADSQADVAATRSVARAVAAERGADVVHANQYALGELPADVPVVLTAHSDVLGWMAWVRHGGERRSPPAEWQAYTALVRRGLERAGTVVAISAFMAAELRRHYGTRRRIEVVHNGWPATAVALQPLPSRPRLSVLAGRAWDQAKNLPVAVEAARGWPVGRVLLAGNHSHPEGGGSATVGPPIEALGWIGRDALDAHLRQARVYLSPARYDPFGLLPVQAALAGCALLLSDIPAYREVWGDAAVYGGPDDVAGLRASWSALLEDDAFAADMAQRARRRALERYGIQRVAAGYEALYATALGARAGPSRGEAVAA